MLVWLVENSEVVTGLVKVGGPRYWGEVDAVHLSGERNRLKVQGLWCRFLLVDSCGWVVNQDDACIEICWRLALWVEGPRCGQLEQEPDSQGASMETGWDTSHGEYHLDCFGRIMEHEGNVSPACLHG